MFQKFSTNFLCLIFLATITFSCTSPNAKDESSMGPVGLVPLVYPPNYTAPTIADTMTLLSWNVEHFVDMYDDPYVNNRRENEVDSLEMEKKYAAFIDVLIKADADVVVLQEFESASFLQRLADTRFPELGYITFQGHESTNWYMNVVVMSRYPLGTFYSYAPWYTAIEGQFEEDGTPAVQNLVNNRMWSVEVLPSQDYQFILTGLHLKAGRGARNEAWRMGQIKALIAQFNRFLALNEQQNLLVVGDFNCTPESAEFQYLLSGEASSSSTVKASFIDPLAGTGVFSHPADSAFWRIDHILPDRNMLPEMVGGSVKPFTVFSPDEMKAIADHLPMISKFILSEQD